MKTKCVTCGKNVDYDSMPTWTLCRDCLQERVGLDKYIDSLGIVWAPKEVEDAGGIEEIERLCSESNVNK